MLTTRKSQTFLAADAAGVRARIGAVLHNAGQSGMGWRIVRSAIRRGTPQ